MKQNIFNPKSFIGNSARKSQSFAGLPKKWYSGVLPLFPFTAC